MQAAENVFILRRAPIDNNVSLPLIPKRDESRKAASFVPNHPPIMEESQENNGIESRN